jgi:hypothetical protein
MKWAAEDKAGLLPCRLPFRVLPDPDRQERLTVAHTPHLSFPRSPSCQTT